MEGSIDYPDILFFEYMTGLIYESACRDDLALISFVNCIKHSEKLSYKHPDWALPYLGLGSVLFSNNEYELAARCFNQVTNL
jgi:tetratricopeptide (TPR) repeat protein